MYINNNMLDWWSICIAYITLQSHKLVGNLNLGICNTASTLERVLSTNFCLLHYPSFQSSLWYPQYPRTIHSLTKLSFIMRINTMTIQNIQFLDNWRHYQHPYRQIYQYKHKKFHMDVTLNTEMFELPQLGNVSLLSLLLLCSFTSSSLLLLSESKD